MKNGVLIKEKAIRAAYIVINIVLLFCIFSAFEIRSGSPETGNIVKMITSKDFSELEFERCNAEISDDGAITYVPNGDDPQVYVPAPKQTVNSIKIVFSSPLSENTNIQVYYATEKGLFEDKSRTVTAMEDANFVMIFFPEGEYSFFRIDIEEECSISSIDIGETENQVVVYNLTYQANFVSIGVFFVLILALVLFEKKLKYFSNIKRLFSKELSFLKEINLKKRKICFILRLGADFVKAYYVLSFIFLVARGYIEGWSIVFFFTASAITLVISLLDKVVNLKDEKPAKVFLTISLISCCMMSYCFPIGSPSWDDRIHFKNSAELRDMLYNDERTLADRSVSIIEKKLGDYIKDAGNTCGYLLNIDQAVVETQSKPKNLYTYIGYLPAATIMFVCDVFNIGFISMNVLAKLCNALVYSIVVYRGMKKLKSGQYILSSVALLPTALFLASVFSYDYWVNAFTMYSIAYLISELQQPEKRFSVKDAVFMLGAMIIGCGPKAVYFVLLVPFLFVQKNKFSGRFTKKKYVISTVLVMCAIAFSFVIPSLVGGVGSDMRGGSKVNAPEQINFILSQPLQYTQILLKHIRSYLSLSNLIGWFGNYAYLGNMAACGTVSVIVMALCALWDKSRCDRFDHCLAFKLTSYLTLFAQVALFSTALYISFTAVGQNSIGGVQGRYVFPLLFPFLYCIGSVHTRSTIKPEFMKGLIFGMLSLNIIWLTYSVYIVKFI